MRVSRGYKTDLVVRDQQAFTAVHIRRMGSTQDFLQGSITPTPPHPTRHHELF